MYKIAKRIIDVVMSTLVLILISWFLLIVAVLIKVESKGPVIFKQKRLGLNGREFDIYKFRSMCEGAEKMGDGQYCFKGDSRVTKVGKVIRALSIDELPQLVNIIKGDMSLIGPRPTLTYHPWPYEEYTEEQKKRFWVRPGVTGWAQVNGRKDVEWNKRIEYDVEYVENLSFGLDLKIFFMTVFKVITMRDNDNKAKTVSDSKPEKLNVTTDKDVDSYVKADVHNK